MTHLSDDTFEEFLVSNLNSDIVDLRNLCFIDPYGMVGILEAGRFYKSHNITKTLLLPESTEVMKYLERMNFFKYSARYFQYEKSLNYLRDKYLRSSLTDVLLEITPIEKSDDIHFIVSKVKKRARSILERHLRYSEKAIHGFIVSLSEVCQNIVEHSTNVGFVGIQKYRFHKLDRNVVKIAVMDLGIGFKNSLSERINVKDDMEALDKALFQSMSRHNDKGRGHGLAAVRRFVDGWNGKLSIRSGSAKLSMIPRWSWGRKRISNLAYFPGAQINIMLPEVTSKAARKTL